MGQIIIHVCCVMGTCCVLFAGNFTRCQSRTLSSPRSKKRCVSLDQFGRVIFPSSLRFSSLLFFVFFYVLRCLPFTRFYLFKMFFFHWHFLFSAFGAFIFRVMMKILFGNFRHAENMIQNKHSQAGTKKQKNKTTRARRFLHNTKPYQTERKIRSLIKSIINHLRRS